MRFNIPRLAGDLAAAIHLPDSSSAGLVKASSVDLVLAIQSHGGYGNLNAGHPHPG